VKAAATVQSGSVPQRKPAAEQFRLGHRRCLDGVRGVAVLAVVVAHTDRVGAALGPIGVDIFFVLSGFLITCLLIEEWDRFHSISLKAFYIRRALRLLPALMVMLAVIVAFHWLFSTRTAAVQTTADALITLFYSANWAVALGFRQLAHAFAHTWTLSIEEQFYLTWPAILLLMLRRTASRASMLIWLALALFLLVLEKVTIITAAPLGSIRWINFATESRSDALLVGCAMSIALSSGLIPSSSRWGLATKCIAWCIALPGLIFLTFADFPLQFILVGFHLTIAVLAAFIILHLLTDEAGTFHRLLAQGWLVYFGKVSYGLYLWHYPVFAQVQAQHWGPVKELIIEIALTMTATVASFYLLERPILKFKQHFTADAHH
jgi:peptidoglycan/LPS O-acetylase OafA/YrhL